MSEPDRGPDHERRLHRAAVTRATGGPPEPVEPDAHGGHDDEAASKAQRFEQQGLWVDLQIRQAMARGDFDNLPGAGKPIPGLDAPHDPDWWVKGLVEREHITDVLPEALQLRKEDARLDDVLDDQPTEADVRRTVEDFNVRVVEARRQLRGGPPVITATRDPEDEVTAWRERRVARHARRRQEQPHLARDTTGRCHRKKRWRPWQQRD